jgi:hypothetical protein
MSGLLGVLRDGVVTEGNGIRELSPFCGNAKTEVRRGQGSFPDGIRFFKKRERGKRVSLLQRHNPPLVKLI